jgi:hypothetical protein
VGFFYAVELDLTWGNTACSQQVNSKAVCMVQPKALYI